MPHTSPYPRSRPLVAALLCCLLLSGCPGPQPSDGTTSKAPLAGVTLHVAVVDDPALVRAIEPLQGEWNARTGGEFKIDSIGQQELTPELKVDAVICPSSLLGPLAEGKLVTPLPEAKFSEVFELLQIRETAWGTDVFGVSFGSPVLTCYCRADLLEKLDRKPPATWPEYHELAELLAQEVPQNGDAWCGTLEPLGPGWAGIVLLARAAPYAKHRDYYSTLFDMKTMEPLIDTEPFIRALEELVAASKLGPTEQLASDPAAVRAAFWQGRCGMALSWPSAAAELPDPPETSDEIRVVFAELPGSPTAYNFGSKSWEERREDEPGRVPLLAMAGRVGTVWATSAQQQPAAELLSWLAGAELSPQICVGNEAMTLFRHSHLESPEAWVEGPAADAALQYAELTEQTLQRQQSVMALRIPGRAEYLAALDEAVRRAVAGEQSPAEALRQAADRWRAVTRQLGSESQKKAYLHSLNLD